MRKSNSFLLFVTLLCSLPNISFADGNELLRKCVSAENAIEGRSSEVNASDMAFCLGFIQGVGNTLQLMNNSGGINLCIPNVGIRTTQSVRIVTSYLRANPQKLHEHEVILVTLAHKEAFACK